MYMYYGTGIESPAPKKALFRELGLSFTFSVSKNIRELKEKRRRRLRKRHLKSEFSLLQTLSRLFQLTHSSLNVGKSFWSWILKHYQSSRKDKESRLVFTSSKKREIRHFHVVVVQWRQRNVQKSVMHVQSCCFVNLNLLLLCSSRCRCRRRCLSSLMSQAGTSIAVRTTDLGETTNCFAV